MMTAHLFLKSATALYILTWASTFLPPALRLRWLGWGLLLAALVANTAAVGLRYWLAWPMMPMYLGSAALPLCLGLIVAFNRAYGKNEGMQRLMMTLVVLLASTAVCFPKDFYLPFLKSGTPFAHLFFIFGVVGKSCFLVGSLWAITGLLKKDRLDRDPKPYAALKRSLRWTVWGFAFWTLSMFAGELWSYIGWGTPVVWDEPTITTSMATWFFYICLLHLHLTHTWSARGQGVFAAFGSLVVLGLNCLPDLGPFRWPL